MEYRLLLDACRTIVDDPQPHEHLVGVGVRESDDQPRTTLTIASVGLDGEVCHQGDVMLAVVRKAPCQTCRQPVLAITPAYAAEELPNRRASTQ